MGTKSPDTMSKTDPRAAVEVLRGLSKGELLGVLTDLLGDRE